MNRPGQSPAQSSPIKPWHLGVVVVLILGFIIYQCWHVFLDSMTIKPEKEFTEAFDNRFDGITDMQAHGKMDPPYDIYMHFKRANNDISPKPADEWHSDPYALETARRYFMDRYPDDEKKFEDINELDIMVRSHREVSSLLNQWLLHNKRTSDYWYRRWGY